MKKKIAAFIGLIDFRWRCLSAKSRRRVDKKIPRLTKTSTYWQIIGHLPQPQLIVLYYAFVASFFLRMSIINICSLLVQKIFASTNVNIFEPTTVNCDRFCIQFFTPHEQIRWNFVLIFSDMVNTWILVTRTTT